MNATHLKTSAVGMAFAAALCAAQPADALEARQCMSMTEMNAALRAEGQRTMVIGDREVLNNPTGRIADASITRYVNTVTSNADGSLGYQLEGDRPRSETSNQVCVRAKLTNIRIFDASQPGVPQQALLGGSFDDALRASDQIGSRPMVLADTVHGSEGSYRLGLPMVIAVNMPYRAGVMLARQSNGAPEKLMDLASLDYTDAGRERARGGNQTLAMLSPR